MLRCALPGLPTVEELLLCDFLGSGDHNREADV